MGGGVLCVNNRTSPARGPPARPIRATELETGQSLWLQPAAQQAGGWRSLQRCSRGTGNSLTVTSYRPGAGIMIAGATPAGL